MIRLPLPLEPQRQIAKQRRFELRLEDRVVWLGDAPQPQVFAEYNRADVFCLPSIQEGFGIVLLEAMAAGKPIVASRAGAIPEVAPYALFPERDTHEFFADRLAQLYRIPALREKLAAKGGRRVERYDAPVVAQQFLDAACGVTPAAAI